jgi:hypothetical protein
LYEVKFISQNSSELRKTTEVSGQQTPCRKFEVLLHEFISEAVRLACPKKAINFNENHSFHAFSNSFLISIRRYRNNSIKNALLNKTSDTKQDKYLSSPPPPVWMK